MTEKEIRAKIERHRRWLDDEYSSEFDSVRADFSREDLHGANLVNAELKNALFVGSDLRYADLREADLREADLSYADLSYADLRGANLSYADLRGANLSYAFLNYADLSDADLNAADLKRAILIESNLTGVDLDLVWPITCPEVGSFIGWKKVMDEETDEKYIVKLLIPEDAKRLSSTGRKCRCNKAIVLEIQICDYSGTPAGITRAESAHDSNFKYIIGETVEVDDFDDDRRRECSRGIHFFITRKEAVDYC